ANKEQTKTKVFQAENEIAVIMAALGAACAGKRSMVGTSGGGFALMTEAISMAGQAEIPIVIVNSQRPGPATGIPTYSGQADLHFTLHSGHGDLLRFVVAPGDAQESAELTALALNIAWKYQMPAIVLTDKDVSEGTYMVDRNILAKLKPQKEIIWDGQGEYKRYCQTNNGISPMAFYGTSGATIKVTSYDHDEFGITVEENESDIKKMADKRLRKYVALEKEVEKMEACKIYGNKNAKKAIIAWGEVKGAAIEAAKKMGIKMIQPLILSPFPARQISTALKGVKKVVSVEMNATGQMAQLFRCHGFKIDSLALKYTGRPFTVEELEKEIIKKLK
ncbi:MAG TPA: pyruvate ferredoxin oxidoreductase, partial [Candidatus Pacearchaeota archaeon]|nr:pyruvate ferredoxin oxidoreductase [Candidatus Pacearchaeota archaeon]